MKNLILIFTISAFHCIGFAQKRGQEKIDSLLRDLKNAKADIVKVNILNELAYEFRNNDPDTAIYFCTRSLDFSKKLNYKIGIADAYLWMGIAITNLGKYDEAEKNIKDALKLYTELLDSETTIDKSKILKQKARAFKNIGNIYYYQSVSSKALDFFFKSLKTVEEMGDKNGMSALFVNIGAVYFQQKDNAKALHYYLKALNIDEENLNKEGLVISLGNVGNVYYELKNYTKAIEYYLKALKISEELGDKRRSATWLNNIGTIYNDQKNYLNAADYHFKALKINEEIGDKNLVATSLFNIGLIYKNTMKYKEAEKYLLRALSLSESIGDLQGIMDAYQSLTNVYEEIGNYKKALDHYKNAMIAKDSLFNEEKTQEITRKEMQYDFDKKETAAKSEQQKKDVIANEELKKQKLIRNSIAGGAGIIILSSLFSFFFYKRKHDAEQKQKETLLSLQVSETEMKALRSQMNPHFIFNALQSIQTFLISNKSEDANIYLLKFSKLMRAVLENSQHSEVPLKDDMQALELYMQLESIRLPHPFTYQFHIDKSIDVESDFLPPLILQPFVENAIWHGLQYKPEAGHINIFITKKDNALHATVEDNGVGRDMSKQVAQPMILKKESLGMKLTEDRLKVLNEVKKFNARFTITDLFSNDNQPAGTKVELSLPLVA